MWLDIEVFEREACVVIAAGILALTVLAETAPPEPHLWLHAELGVAAAPGIGASAGPALGAEVDVRLLPQVFIVAGGRHSFHRVDGASANLTQAWLGGAYELDHTPVRVAVGAGFAGFRYALPGQGNYWDWGAYLSITLSGRPAPWLSTGVQLRYDSMQVAGFFPGYLTLSVQVGWVGL